MAKKDNNELMDRNHAFLIYQDDNGIARVKSDKQDFTSVEEEVACHDVLTAGG